MPGTIERPDDLTIKPRVQLDGNVDHPRKLSVMESFNVGDSSFSYTYDPISYEDSTKQAQIEAGALSVEETIELAASAVQSGRLETQRSLAGSEGVSDAVRPKLTIDLGHSNIARIPEPVVDLIKDEVERLSLSHNQIFHLHYRFSECSQLRYLNVRANVFREFPKAVYKLPLLEILDLSRNKIRRIPLEIKQLTSLRVFSIQHNRLDELPPTICEMNKLQILKVTGNPLRFMLKRVLEAKEAEVSRTNMTENEKEAAVTAEIKNFLKTKLPAVKADAESGGESSEGTLDTPKPIKRGLASRFPVIPSTNKSDSASELRPPPIPTRSHYRMLSSQNVLAANPPLRRPGIAPVVSGNERNRSNSESVLQASAAARSKRMGMMKRSTELGPVEEGRVNRHSHLRGQSHGSVLRSTPTTTVARTGSNSNPTSPGFASPRKMSRRNRDYSIRPMSALPEHREAGASQDILVEGAKGLLYALFQVHSHIATLINVLKKTDDTTHQELEAVFHNASVHYERLNEILEKLQRKDQDIKAKVSKVSLKRECLATVMAYSRVGVQIQWNVTKIVEHVDQRYLRSLMLAIYGSIVEIGNALTAMNITLVPPRKSSNGANIVALNITKVMPQTFKEEPSTYTSTDQPPANDHSATSTDHSVSSTDQSATPTRDRPKHAPRRMRSDTAFQTQAPMIHQPPLPLYLNNRSRSNSRTNTLAFASAASSVANTPRSGESFNLMGPPMTTSRINTMHGIDEAEEERIFEKIFLQLTYAYENALKALPLVLRQFARALENAEHNRAPPDIRRTWFNLIQRCKACIEVSDLLKLRLSNMKVNQPGGSRSQRDFWLLCKSFMQSFVDLVTDMRDVKTMVPRDVVIVLKPVHKASRDAGKLIEESPWSYLADMTTPSTTYQQTMSLNTISPVSVPLPATPLSAALGPAAQATVPSTPASAYSTDRFFQGDVFQRADSLLAMPQPMAYRR